MPYYNTILRMLDEAHLHEDEFGDEDHHHEEEHHDDGKPWGDVIAASLIIQSITLAGLLFTVLVGYYGRVKGNRDKLLHLMSFKVVPSFACGALLATAVLLVIPESLVLLSGGHGSHGEAEEAHHEEEEHHEEGERFFRLLEGEEEGHYEEDNEAEASWKFGAALLSGFLFPILLHVFFPKGHAAEEAAAVQVERVVEEEPEEREGSDEDDEKISDKSPSTQTTDLTTETKSVDWTLASSIVVGDFFHNFTDGVFVGTSFLLCSRSVGYTLVATTIYHELAQEIADFALLHHHCGLSVWKAVLFNFVSGFSVVIGALFILSFNMSETAQGITLAIAAGIYIYIAACECVPRIRAANKGPKDTLLFLIFFILGAVPIGLVLLNHEHCEAGHGEEHHEEHGDEEVRWLF